jgi:hypothetical protein
VAGAAITRFLFFHEGGEVLSLLLPVLVKAIFFHDGQNLPPPLLPFIAVFRPSWRYAQAHDILGDVKYAPIVYIHGGGAVFGVDTPPIEKIKRDNI